MQILLGFVQGVTEWLPISSSGHLAVLETLFGVPPDLSYDVFLHGASLLVLVVYFRKDLARLSNSLFDRREKQDRQFVTYCVAATVVTIAVALLVGRYEPLMRGYGWLIAGFAINAVMLLLVYGIRPQTRELTMRAALLIGLAQGIAVVPAISRSGITIAIALLLGIDGKTAFRFSFLLAIPALGAALVYTQPSLVFQPVYLLGFITTFIAGYGALKLLERVLMHNKFYLFWMYNAAMVSILIALYAWQ